MSAMERCRHCGKRIFFERDKRYNNHTWRHYGYAQRECGGRSLKYAEPPARRDKRDNGDRGGE